LEYYKYKEFEIMIPKIFGVEVKKNIKSSGGSSRVKWDKKSFLNAVRESSTAEAFDKVERILNYAGAQINGNVKFGTGKSGAFGYKVELPKGGVQIFEVRIEKDEWHLKFDMGWYDKQLDEEYAGVLERYFSDLIKINKIQKVVATSKNKKEYALLESRVADILKEDLSIIEKMIDKTTKELVNKK
jgi:hypothetical protein